MGILCRKPHYVFNTVGEAKMTDLRCQFLPERWSRKDLAKESFLSEESSMDTLGWTPICPPGPFQMPFLLPVSRVSPHIPSMRVSLCKTSFNAYGCLTWMDACIARMASHCKGQKGALTPLGLWPYRWLWASMWVLRIKFRPSGRADGVINHWAISRVHGCLC